MERLTDKRMKGEGFISVDPKEYKAFIKNEKPTGKQIYQRLLEIEDILGDDYDLDRLRELVEAGRGGRCVVLPCKVGDKVKIDANTWGNVWNYKTIEHGKFLVGEIISIIKTKKQTLIKIKAEHNVEWKRPTKRYPVSAIGLTVFVKSKSAVAALKGEKDGE